MTSLDTQRAIAIGGLVATALIAVFMVVFSLQGPEVPAFEPSTAPPVEVGDELDGPHTYTLDASQGDRWHFFDFSSRAERVAPGPVDWDLAVRRFHVIANGGAGFQGRGGIADLGRIAFDSVASVPETGYVATVARADSVNDAIGGWYRYGFSTHVLTPRGHVYAVRTADGRYAKLEILSYYCPGARPGCLTFRYVYQGDGSTSVEPGPGAHSQESSGR